MITKEDTLYVTVGLSRYPDGSIRVFVPNYDNAAIVREKSHKTLHGRLAYLLDEYGAGKES